MELQEKHYWGIGVGGILILVLVFVFGKQQGKKAIDKRRVRVNSTVRNISTGDVQQFEQNDLLERLNKGLTSWYFVNASERCNPIRELLYLSNAEFMAAIYGYQEKFDASITDHMNKCWWTCDDGYTSLFFKVKQKIKTLKEDYTHDNN